MHAPVARDLVPRLDPLASLCAGPPRRLTLIRAPAGWGKSSLVSTWSTAPEETRRFAWLALDRGDNDPIRFFRYVIQALRALSPGLGEQAEAILRAPGISLVDDLLPVLINELDVLEDECVLVIEDYHLITSAEVHEAIAFLLDHAPSGLELVLTTRVEPPLPIARLRARGELLEIGTTQLGFSDAEAASLLNDHQGLGIERVDVSRLVERTEGWPAGLYLAALSLRGRSDAPEFIATFAGDDRNVVDYLTSEVLAGQSADVYDFLLSTSVLEQLSPELCDEVTGTSGSAALLREIEGSNAFLIALDSRREWYRYHHLFRDLLRNELAITDPGRAVDAHRRAAAWLSGRGETSEAIMHTIAAGDTPDAVEMVAESWRPLSYSGGHQTVERWLEALPPEVHRGDARLCVASAVTAIATGRIDEVGPWLALAGRAPTAGPFHDGFGSGAGAVAVLTTASNWLTGDLEACRETALAAIGPSGPPTRWDAFAHTWLGASTFWLGDSVEGLDQLELALERCRSAPLPPMDGQADEASAQISAGGATTVACLGMLALAHLIQGDLDRAQERVDAALTLSDRSGLKEYWVNAAAHIAGAGLLTHAGRADAAGAELDRALEVARRGSGPVETIHALVARCLAARAEGDDDAAGVHLGDARSTLLSCPNPGPVVTSLVMEAEAGLPEIRGRVEQVFPFVEEFSEREIDVLRLLGGSLSQREIGDELFISFNTVKTHSKSIYRKLGVGRRTDAVTRGRELGLT